MLIATDCIPHQVKASAKEGVDYAWEHARQIEAEREERAAAAAAELAKHMTVRMQVLATASRPSLRMQVLAWRAALHVVACIWPTAERYGSVGAAS